MAIKLAEATFDVARPGNKNRGGEKYDKKKSNL